MLSLSTLLKSGFTPTLKDVNNLLLFLSRNRKFKSVIHVFSQLNANKMDTDTHTHTIFTKALLKENKYEEAAEFLKNIVGNSEILQRNRVFDSLIQGLCKFNRDPDNRFSLLRDLSSRTNGFSPSSRTFCVLICCFSRMGKMDRVIDLLELMSDDRFNYPFDNFVCSSVISGFVSIGKPELAIGFYENALKSGSLRPNVVTCTALMSAYCKLRTIDKVSELVAWMEDNHLGFDVVFYSNWISECFRKGLVEEAFWRFRSMVNKKVDLDHITYTILIDGFSKDGNVEKAVGFLHKMRKDGLEPNVVTYTVIILGFCKKCKLGEAFAIFGMLKRLGIEPDEFMYAILIDGVCRKGDFHVAHHLLDEMCNAGVKPTIVTYNTIINGLSKAGRTSEADNFSKCIVGDVFTYTTLLQGYVEEKNNFGILETKRRLEEAGLQMDVVLCNILVKAFVMVGLFEDAFEIYKGLPQMGLVANSVTFCTLIDGFCKAGRVNEALDICIEYAEKDLPLDRKIYMVLIEEIFKRKGAQGVMEMIHKTDIVFNEAIFFLCGKGFPEASYSVLLLAMRRKELSPMSICYYSILRRLLFEGKISLTRLILTSFIKIYSAYDLRVCEIIVYYLCLHDVKKVLIFLSTMKETKLSIAIPIHMFKAMINDGCALDAYELLTGTGNNVLDKNVFHYSFVIDALCKARHIKKALDLCNIAKEKGIDLNIVTYDTVINGLCMHGCLVEAFRIFDSLERINLLPTQVTYGTLINALVREGLIKDAKILFERMFLKNLGPGLHIFNSLIDGYCKANLLEEAIELFRDLESRNLEPDGFTVSALINGYCTKGDMEGALKLFFEFHGRDLLPDFLGFMYLIRGLCAKGRMEESRSILREMLKTKPVVDLLKMVRTEGESDSLDKIVISLCEHGCINEAVEVLNEVGSVLFSAGRHSCHGALLNPCDYYSMPSYVEKVEDMLGNCAGENGRTQELKDFDSIYSKVHSLCRKGELVEANRLTKLLMEL